MPPSKLFFKLRNEPQGVNFKKSKYMPTYPNDNTYYEFLAKLMGNLNMLRHNRRFCDVTIKINSKKFHVHRAVLAASSPYFHAMFTGDLVEKNKKCVELHMLHPSTFELLLDFMYSGSVIVTKENVENLMIAADMFQIIELIAECTYFLIDQLHESNAIGIYLLIALSVWLSRFARDHNILDLKVSAIRYIEEHFPLIIKEDELVDLDKDCFDYFLGSECLKISSEIEILQAVLKWVNHDLPNRSQYIFDVLRKVRLSLIPFTFLERTVAQTSNPCLKNALKSVHDDIANKKGDIVPLDSKPRKGAKKYIYVIGGSKRELGSVWDRGVEVNYDVSIEMFDPFLKQWNQVPNMHVNRLVPGVAALNGAIYVVGGEEGSNILSSCERYDPVTQTWTEVASLNLPRCEFGLCALDGYLYAMGGWVTTDISGLIERYDPRTDCWEIVGNLPEPRFSMGLVSYEGLIYMVGGCSLRQRNIPDLMSYNPVTKKWQKLPEMSVARFQMGVAVLDDYLYVVGGTNSQEVLNSVERYSFKKNKWETVPRMTLERSGPAVGAMDGLLYVIGGAQTKATRFYRACCTISAVECFDPYDNKWTDCPPLSETRAEAGAVVL